MINKEIKQINYQKVLDKILNKIESENNINLQKPSLLLHACCAPCSSYVIEYLSKYFSIDIYYYNPNITPKKEFDKRLLEIETFIKNFPVANGIKVISEPYNSEEFFEAINIKKEPELKKEPEQGERCRRCYQLRLEKTFKFAKKMNYDWFTTTLSISPYKNAVKINDIGSALQTSQKPFFLTSDFKKHNGYLRSIQLSTEYNLYRQNYCGCIYSQQN